jgi:hypothetical protein
VESLCARGLVAEEQRKALGVFPVRRYPEADGSVEQELRARLTAAVREGAEPDDRTSGLIALLHGAELHRSAFPGVPKKQIAPRMKEIADGEWAGDSVRRAIRDMQAVMMAATAATAAVIVTSG